MMDSYNLHVLKTSGMYALSGIVTWQYVGHVMTKYYEKTIIKPSDIINNIANFSSKLFLNLGQLTRNIFEIIYNVSKTILNKIVVYFGNIGHYIKCFVVDIYEVTKDLIRPTFKLLISPINYLKKIDNPFNYLKKFVNPIFCFPIAFIVYIYVFFQSFTKITIDT